MKLILATFCLTVVQMSIVCKNINKKNSIFLGLDKSYILNKSNYTSDTEFYDEYQTNYQNFHKDSVEYKASLQRLFSSSTDIIEELLKFEGNKGLCNWIKTKGPYSSTIVAGDFYDKSSAAKILIDNYILNSDKIVVNYYVEKISYLWLKKWYKPTKNRNQLKFEYEQYIKILVKNDRL